MTVGAANSGSVPRSESSKTLKRSSSKQQRFEIVRKLGSGTYGKVSLAIDHRSGEQVAIKIIKKQSIENAQDLLRIKREIRIMSALRHPNIIEIKEVFENSEKIVIIMEHANGGELYDYVSNMGPLSEMEVRRLFRQIVSAVYYCHKSNVTHRDLKLENILLDQKLNAKIADFGLSNYFGENELLHTFCGSPLYASPEIINGIPYRGPEVDCWSLGVLLYSLAYSSMPFDGRDFNRMIRQIKRGIYYEPDNPSSASTLIRIMLRVNPERRATIEDVAKHWWLNFDVDSPSIENLPENQVTENVASSEEQSFDGLQVQTFIDESEIFAEFIHLNAATRKRVEEFRKKRKEADAFLSSTNKQRKDSDPLNSEDPMLRLQALEQQLQSLTRKTATNEGVSTQRKESILTEVVMDNSLTMLKTEVNIIEECKKTTDSRKQSNASLSKVQKDREEKDTQEAIEQSVLAESNRLANQLVEEQFIGNISAELVEKVKKLHDQYEIPVLKELLDSIINRDVQHSQQQIPGQLPDIVKHDKKLCARTYGGESAAFDVLQEMDVGSAIEKPEGEAEDEEQEVVTVEYEDLAESEEISLKSTLDDSVADSLTLESDVQDIDDNHTNTSLRQRSQSIESNSSEYSVGLSKRQSRGKYERSKFTFGREISIEESPKLARKRVGGVQPEVKDAPALFDRAKKYILQYPDAIASTDSMQMVAERKVPRSVGETEPDKQSGTKNTEPIYEHADGKPKLYKVLWPRASIDMPMDPPLFDDKTVNKNVLNELTLSSESSEQEEKIHVESASEVQSTEPSPIMETREMKFTNRIRTECGIENSKIVSLVDQSRAKSAIESLNLGYSSHQYRRPFTTVTASRYADSLTDTGSSHRTYGAPIYPYFGGSTYRTQLEHRDTQDGRSTSAYSRQGDRRLLYKRISYASYLDELTGSDTLAEYAPRSYVRSRYNVDYQRNFSSDKTYASDFVTQKYYGATTGNRSHSLFELSTPTKRSSIASYHTPITTTGDPTDYGRTSVTNSGYQQTPRRRAFSLYDTREPTINSSDEFTLATRFRDSNEMKPTYNAYGKKGGENFSYRRSLYDVEDGLNTGVTSGQRHNRISSKQSVKIRAYSFDKQIRDVDSSEGTSYMSLVSKPYIYPIYCHTAYHDTSGNDTSDYPKTPPDSSTQPVKGILKNKKPITSTSSTPTDEDSGYSSVPAIDVSSTSAEKSSKGNNYFNWRTKNSMKTFGIMDRLKKRMNNGEKENDERATKVKEYKSSSGLEESYGPGNANMSAKYGGKTSVAPSNAYSIAKSTDKTVSLDLLEKGEKPRKKKTIWNLARRCTNESNYSPVKSTTTSDNSYLSRPSSPLGKLKGFFASTPTSPAGVVETKTRSFGYPSTGGIGSSCASKLNNRTSYASVVDTSLSYGVSSTINPNPIVYRKFSKSGIVRPHSSYTSTSRNWYEDNTYY